MARADGRCRARVLRHRDHLARSVRGEARRRLVLRPKPARPRTSPIDHRYAGAPDQLGVERAVAALKPWLEDPSRKKLGQNLKYDQHVLANHGVRLAGRRARHAAPVLRAREQRPARHGLARRAPPRPQDHHLRRGHRARARNASASSRWTSQRATDYAAEDADVTLRLHRVLYPKIAADEKLRRVYETIEMPVREVLFADGTHRRADRRRRPRAPGPRARAEDARARAESVRRGRAAVQPQLAQADRRDLLRTPAAPGDQEDAERRAVDRRGRAREARARLPAAEDAARYRALSKLNRPTPTSCRGW